MSSSQSTTGQLPGVRGAAVFYLLAFAISWAIWGAQIVLPQLAEWDLILIIVGAYGPLIAALVLSRIAGGPRGAWHWLRSVSGVRRQWRWILLAGLVLPLLIALAHLVLYRVLVGPFTLSVDPPWYWAVSTSPLAILLLFWMSSAVEEFGWQGFAMPRLTADMHPLIALSDPRHPVGYVASSPVLHCRLERRQSGDLAALRHHDHIGPDDVLADTECGWQRHPGGGVPRSDQPLHLTLHGAGRVPGLRRAVGHLF